MININLDSYNKNINNTTDNFNVNSNLNNNSLKKLNVNKGNNSDSIEIEQTNEKLINKTKAYNAFHETCNEIGPSTWNSYEQSDITTHFLIIADAMKDSGISVPNFIIDKNNIECSNFIDFVDKIKKFANNSLQNGKFDSLPTNFNKFCDKYKENLIKYNCF